MKRLRKIIFWIHLPVGIVGGLVILMMSATGVILTYERQITAWADSRNCQPVVAPAGTERLSIETIVAKIREKQPTAITAITVRADKDAPISIGLPDNRTVFANPYTGEIVGEGSQKTRSFFRSVTDWHRWLGAQTENRANARVITGACNFGFLILVVSGFYLWFPRKRDWAAIKNVILFRRRLSGRARDFNWHNVAGFWATIPLFIIVLAGVVMSYTWANNLVYRIVGEAPPAPRTDARSQQRPEGQPRERSERDQREARAEAPFEGLDKLWPVAEQQMSGWQSITLRVPTNADAPTVFAIDQGDGGQPQSKGQLTLNRKTGEVVRWEPFSSNTAGRRLRSYLRFAHTGEVAGIIGQTIAGLASAAGALLVWTGLAMAFRRCWSWVAKRSRRKVTVVANADAQA